MDIPFGDSWVYAFFPFGENGGTAVPDADPTFTTTRDDGTNVGMGSAPLSGVSGLYLVSQETSSLVVGEMYTVNVRWETGGLIFVRVVGQFRVVAAEIVAGNPALSALLTGLVESYRSTGNGGSVAQLLYELIAHTGNSEVVGTLKTLLKTNQTPSGKTFNFNDAANPTQIHEAT